MAQAVGWCVALDQDAVGGLEALGEGGSWRRVNDWKVGVGGEELRMSLQELGIFVEDLGV